MDIRGTPLVNSYVAPFQFGELQYPTVDHWWYAMQLPDFGMRLEALERPLEDVSRIAKEYRDTHGSQSEFSFMGERVQRGSARHQDLLRLAMRSKFNAHPEIRSILVGVSYNELFTYKYQTAYAVDEDHRNVRVEWMLQNLEGLRTFYIGLSPQRNLIVRAQDAVQV